MNELIVSINGVPTLDGGTVSKIAEFEAKVKEIKAKEDELKAEILKEMEAKGILKIDNDEMTISYVAATHFESFDSKTFRKEHPDTYDGYCEIKEKKAYIKINVKGTKRHE